MLNRLKQIYKNKLLLNVESFDFEHYYYFYSSSKEVFGIEKTISLNEYELIASSFIEKKVFDNNEKNQSIFEYLFDDKKYPFNSIKQVFYITCDSLTFGIKDSILEVFKSCYMDVDSIKLNDDLVLFVSNSYYDSIENIISPLNEDTDTTLKIHKGIYINKNIKGNDLLNYFTIIKKFILNAKDLYSDVASPIVSDCCNIYKESINNLVLKNAFKDALMKDLIINYFRNDLNVSKTSKDMYLNRNSLLNRFESFYKTTGFDLQNFSHCAALFILMA